MLTAAIRQCVEDELEQFFQNLYESIECLDQADIDACTGKELEDYVRAEVARECYASIMEHLRVKE